MMIIMLHKQKSLYEISSKEKADLADMILVAINEVTKFDPEKADGEYITYTWTEVNVPEGYSLIQRGCGFFQHPSFQSAYDFLGFV